MLEKKKQCFRSNSLLWKEQNCQEPYNFNVLVKDSYLLLFGQGLLISTHTKKSIILHAHFSNKLCIQTYFERISSRIKFASISFHRQSTKRVVNILILNNEIDINQS